MDIRILSIGCRLNRAEIESIASTLAGRGHRVVTSDDADVYIVNTCVVTGRSEQKTRQLIHRAIEASGVRPGSRIIVAGCGAGAPRREGAIIYVPPSHKAMIPDIIENHEAGWMNDRSDTSFRYATPVRSSLSRAHLKIQDGCGNTCTYCIVPLVRGAPRSRDPDDAVDEFRRLIEAGYREIVLTGVMIGSYRCGDVDLTGLIERILSISGSFRIHLSSITPSSVTQELIALLKEDRMVKHLHLSLQSGSDAVLARMGRPYTGASFRDLVSRVRDHVPDINLTGDVIVGFPGETEDDFRATLETVAAAGLTHVHTFRYSPRPGTPAAAMGDTVPPFEKAKRSRMVLELSKLQKEEYYRRFDGRVTTFMSERSKKGKTTGFNEYYVPLEVEGILPRREFFTVTTVFIPGSSVLAGRVV